MTLPFPHDDDVFAWSRHQAAVLRLLGRAPWTVPNDLDLEHVAEEIEDVGSETLDAVVSHLGNILVHLLKVASLPAGAPPLNHWRREIRTWQRQCMVKDRPSMRHLIDLQDLWSIAMRDARADLRDEGDALIAVPAACPLTLDTLLARDFDVQTIAADLVAAASPDAK